MRTPKLEKLIGLGLTPKTMAEPSTLRTCETCKCTSSSVILRSSDCLECESCWNTGSLKIREDTPHNHRPLDFDLFPLPTYNVGLCQSTRSIIEDKHDNNDLVNHSQVIEQPSLSTTLESIEAPPLLPRTPSITDANEDLQQSFSSDGKSVGKTDVFIYDNLIDQVAISTKSGRDRFKFNGSLMELKELIKLVLKMDGQWTVRKIKI